MTYHLVSFGCQMNLSDTERIATVLDSAGFVRTGREGGCGPDRRDRLLGTAAGDRPGGRPHRALERLEGAAPPAHLRLRLRAAARRAAAGGQVRLPGAHRGRAVAARPDPPGRGGNPSLRRRIPGHGRCLLEDHPALLLRLRRVRGPSRTAATSSAPSARSPTPVDARCRGRPRGILDEVGRLVGLGYHSITLLGQNVNSYGADASGECGFAELLHRVAELCEKAGRTIWVYYTSPHPQDMSTEVLETMAAHPSIAKQVHLPLQSGGRQDPDPHEPQLPAGPLPPDRRRHPPDPASGDALHGHHRRLHG